MRRFSRASERIADPGTRITSVSGMRIESHLDQFSFGAEHARTGPAHLVLPAQEAGRADQRGHRPACSAWKHLRSADTWEPHGPIPFADHLTRSNRQFNEATFAPKLFSLPQSPSCCRPLAEREKTRPLAPVGNDRCGVHPPRPCKPHAQLARLESPAPRQIALAVLAYQIRHPISLGRLMDVVL